jgi:hypothetical protein
MDMDPTIIFGLLGGGLSLVAGLCACLSPLVILGGFAMFFVRRNKQAVAIRGAAQHWQNTQGVVVSSEMRANHAGSGYTLEPHIAYTYSVGNRQMRGMVVRAGEDKLRVSAGVNVAWEIVNRYPVGTTVTVYYDPANPVNSALER